jgi:hypothetical protein
MDPVSTPATQFSIPPLVSGHRWLPDDGTYPDCPGRNSAWSMRAEGDPRITVRAKTVPTACEVHSLAMERVAFVLGSRFGLPIPPTYLEQVEGRIACVQVRVPRAESWLTSPPSAAEECRDAMLYAKSATFDLVMANTDRNGQHLLYDRGSDLEIATDAQLSLVDHGYCGLWPPGKLVNSWEAPPLWSDQNLRAGGLSSLVERQIANLFPPPYRRALYRCPPAQIASWLEEFGEVLSRHLTYAIAEVTPDHISAEDAAALKTFLIRRRKSLILILGQDDGWMTLQRRGVDGLLS